MFWIERNMLQGTKYSASIRPARTLCTIFCDIIPKLLEAQLNASWLMLQVCTDMGLEATISVSTKLGDVGNLFQKIVDAAQHPHRSIPKTEAGRKFKHYRCLIQWSLTVAAGMSWLFICSQGCMCFADGTGLNTTCSLSLCRMVGYTHSENVHWSRKSALPERDACFANGSSSFLQ